MLKKHYDCFDIMDVYKIKSISHFFYFILGFFCFIYFSIFKFLFAPMVSVLEEVHCNILFKKQTNKKNSQAI